MASTINASSSGSGGLISTGDASGVLQLLNNGTVAVTVTGGAVGIGTSSPAKLLHLYASNDAASARFTNTAANKVWDLTPAYPGVVNSGFSLYNVTDNTIPLHVKDGGTVLLQGGSTSATGVGITFPATQSASSDANCLDDYEEGTWTPILRTETGSTTGITYAAQTGGTYTKIGNIVTLQFDIKLTNKGTPTGTYVMVGGLPFALGSALQEVGHCNLWFGSLSVGWVCFGLQQNSGDTAFYVWGNKAANTGVAYPTFGTDLSNTTEFGGTVIYRVA